MIYLTKLLLNPRSRQVRSELVNPYQMHRTILHAFPVVLPEDERVLFRVDLQPQSGIPIVLVQSKHKPDWSWLSEKDYLLPDGEKADFGEVDDNPAIKPFELRLSAGQVLAFRLRANPTKRLGKSAGENAGKRIGVYSETDQLEWLQRKASAGGFQIHQVQASQEQFLQDKGKLNQGIDLFSVLFDGVLRVIDPVIMQEAVQQGIGSAKGFGFGLLSLAPYHG